MTDQDYIFYAAQIYEMSLCVAVPNKGLCIVDSWSYLMALEARKFEKLKQEIEDFAENAPMGEENREFVMEKILGEAFNETEELVDESRPPRLYVFGRSGAGKSSLINALAGREVAEVGAVEPTTLDSDKYHIQFPERYSSWDVIDSRGLFETVSPEGDMPADTVEFMRQDLEKYRPDILFHVVTPDHVRAGREDFDAIGQLQRELDGVFPPVVYCLNKVDIHKSPGGSWPPEDNPELAGSITENLDFVGDVIENQEGATITETPFKQNQPLYGYTFDSDTHIGVIPLYLKEPENYWNIHALSWLVGDFLPDDARLQFMQAQQRERLMRELSRDMTKRFSAIAGGVGAAPVPFADIAALTPLQLFLVALVGGFSCEDIEWSLVQDYLSAFGMTGALGFGARELVRTTAQFLPGVGTAVSASIAYATTYAIGRSAEEYFFNDNVVKPSELVEEGKQRFKRSNGA